MPDSRVIQGPYSEVVAWFARQMRHKLCVNKGRASSWRGEFHCALLKRLREEVEELEAALTNDDQTCGSAACIIKECADVANFAMMIADKKRLFSAGTVA